MAERSVFFSFAGKEWKSMRKFARWFRDKYFVAAFFFTMIFIFLLAGITTVDYRGRAMTFDDTAPVVALIQEEEDAFLQFHVFGKEREMDVSGIVRFLEGLADFVCFPHD